MADEDDRKRRQEMASRLASWDRAEVEPKPAAAGRTIPFFRKKEDKAASPPPAAPVGMDRKLVRRKWPPRRIAAFGAAALFAGAVVYEIVFGDHSTRLNVETERITLSTVTRGPFHEFIPVRGEVQPIQTVFLDAQESGRVEEVYLQGGAMVEKGDAILKLANPALELQVMNTEAQFYEQMNNFEQTRITLEQQAINSQRALLEMQQQVRRATKDFEYDKERHKIGVLSNQAYLASKDDYEFYLKRLEFTEQNVRQDSLARVTQMDRMTTAQKNLQRNLEAAKLSLSNLTVRAPVSGQLTSLNAEVGQLKNRGERFGQVDVLDSYKVRAGIDEFYITRISAGQTGTFELAGKTYGLQIRHVYPEVVEGRFNVDLEFTADTPSDIRRGQTLPIHLVLGDLVEALLLERGGFYQTTGGNWVFVLDESGTVATRRSIRIGRQNPEYFEVLEGLQPGERAVTSSYENYEEIDKLILK